MAKKGKKKKRSRRSPEQIIEDLQEEIRQRRENQRAAELRSSPAHKSAMAALRAIDKALDVAADERQTALRHALADGRRSLARYFESKGVEPGKANLPKGRRPKD